MTRQNQAYIFALTAIALWSTVATAFKLTLSETSPVQMLFWASLTSLLIFIFNILISGKARELSALKLSKILLIAFTGLLNPFIYYLVLFEAYNILPAQLAQPLNYTWPLMLVLLSWPILGQKFGIKSILALIVSFTGVILIAGKGNFLSFESGDLAGIFLALGSSLIWALYWLINMKFRESESIKLAVSFASGTFFIYIWMLINGINIDVSANGLFGSIYIGLFEMGITFFFWLKAMTLSENNSKIGSLVFLSPFLSLIFISLILGETIYSTTIIGLILIVLGIIIEKSENKFKKS